MGAWALLSDYCAQLLDLQDQPHGWVHLSQMFPPADP